MPSKPQTFPEFRFIMVSFDMMPRHDVGVMQMARADLSRMKKVTKAKNALARCNAFRVWRSDTLIRIEFMESTHPDTGTVRLRMIYELAPPFG